MENNNPFNIPQAYFDFVENGGELPEDNGYHSEPVKKMELKEKVYKHIIYEWDKSYSFRTSTQIGYYLVKYVDIIEDGFECLVWFTELECFGSIDGEHNEVWVLEDYETWEEILENFEIACNPEWDMLESFDPDIPLHPIEDNDEEE